MSTPQDNSSSPGGSADGGAPLGAVAPLAPAPAAAHAGVQDSGGPYAPFAIRDFRLFIIMVALTSLAQQAQGVAIGWDVYERTGSAMALGWIGLVQFIPVLAFFLPAGQWADRYDRRRVCAISMVVWCISALLLAGTSRAHGSVLYIYLAVAATGLATVLNRAARDALLSQLVPETMLARAVTWNSTIFQTAAVAGPGIAGLLIAIGGTAFTVYAVNLVCLLVSMVTVLAIAARPPAGPKRASSWREMFGGMAHVWNTKVVFGAMTVDLFAVMLGGATALLPLYAKDILHTGAAGLGWLSAAPAIGAVLMAISQGHRKAPAHAGRTFLWAVGLFGLSTVVFGLSTNYWLSLFALIAIGATDNMGAVIRQTAVQLYTPDELRGRVAAVNRVFISSSNELGAVESGLLASLIGAVPAVALGGLATMVIAGFGFKLFPALKELETVQGKR
jgi:MFS family permease